MYQQGAANAEFRHHATILFSPLGHDGSGLERFGAAMYMHKHAGLPLKLLEIYRICCKLDHEDPVDLAIFEGVDVSPSSRGRRNNGLDGSTFYQG